MSPLPTTHRRITASEYFGMPEGPPYFQLVHRELFISPSPVIRHQKVLGKIYRLVDLWYNQIEVHRFAEGNAVTVTTFGMEDELSTLLLPGLEVAVKQILV